METKITNEDVQISKYILQILMSQHVIVWSWGFEKCHTVKKGIRFNVSGFLHQGFVEVVYDEGSDLFDIKLLDKNLNLVKELNGVFFDELVTIIDEQVEKIENYNDHVTSFLNLN